LFSSSQIHDKKGTEEESHCALSDLDQIDVNLVKEADHMDGYLKYIWQNQ